MADYPSSPYTNIDIRMISLYEIERWAANEILNLYPSYGRRFCWGEQTMSELIETIIRGYPVSNILISELDTGKYEVVDGTQRLVTIIRFLHNEFCLKTEDHLLNNKYFRDLDSITRRKIEDYRIIACFIRPESQKDMRDMFMAINDRGAALSPQEIRHAKFAGRRMAMIEELCQEPEFVRQIKGKGIRMNVYQDEELVLRFMAFYFQGFEKYRGNMQKFLNNMMENYEKFEYQENEFKIRFREVFEAAGCIWGDDAFCLPRKYRSNRRLCRELYDVITYSFTQYSLEQLIIKKESIRKCLDNIMNVREFREAVTGKEKGRTNVTVFRFTKWMKMMREVMEGVNV